MHMNYSTETRATLLSDISRERKKNFLLEYKKKKRKTEKIVENLQKNLSNQ